MAFPEQRVYTTAATQEKTFSKYFDNALLYIGFE
jgi:hypothetical protein